MILHVMILDKFLAPFIDFVDEHFGREGHKYVFITSEKYEHGLTPEHNVEFLHTDEDIFITLLQYMTDAEKIILHGLWRDKVDLLLYKNRKLLSKCYWIMWGGDFYFPEKQPWIKKKVIKHIGFLVTGTKGDIDLVRKWYGASGKHIKCFNYPSNLFKEISVPDKTDACISILVGNSATETNNHFNVLGAIKKHSEENIKVYLPLSYGDVKYAKSVIYEYTKVFNGKCIPVLEFMDFNDYMSFLASVDIAIFDHERQQGFGNSISLLGMGKKVYLNPMSTLNGVMDDYELKVYDLNGFSVDLIEHAIKEKNIQSVKKNFSKESLVASLKAYLE